MATNEQAIINNAVGVLNQIIDNLAGEDITPAIIKSSAVEYINSKAAKKFDSNRGFVGSTYKNRRYKYAVNIIVNRLCYSGLVLRVRSDLCDKLKQDAYDMYDPSEIDSLPRWKYNVRRLRNNFSQGLRSFISRHFPEPLEDGGITYKVRATKKNRRRRRTRTRRRRHRKRSR